MDRNSALLTGSLWTLVGQVGPTAAGILLIPQILSLLGTERFGLLSMAWMAIGYFALFDVGVTRAITQLVAASEDGLVVRRMLAVANGLMLVFGAAAGIIVVAVSWYVVDRLFRVPESLVREALSSLWIMAAALPITLLTASYRSIAEGKLAFAPLNVLRTPLGIANFVAPWLVGHVTPRLDVIVAALMVVRVIGLVLHVWLVRRIVGRIGFVLNGGWAETRSLLRFGGWIAVSNFLSPLMTSFDRFVIGAMLSLSAVSYYVTPYEAVTKMWIVAGAVGSVVFPHFSRPTDAATTRRTFARGLTLIGLALGPLVLVVLIWGQGLLSFWIAPEFATRSISVARTLSVAVLINALAFVPFSLIQGKGRPDITAKFHLLELPLYWLLLVILIKLHGIDGAAVAYAIRVTVDAALLFLYARRFTQSVKVKLVITP